jgi:hypothetical protein
LSFATTNLSLSDYYIASQYEKLSLVASVAANESTGIGCRGLQFAGMTNRASNPAMSQLTGFGSLFDHLVWINSSILGGLGGTVGDTPSEKSLTWLHW